MAVNAAVVRGRPLLVKGEPGTGKTQLAEFPNDLHLFEQSVFLHRRQGR